MRQPYRTVAAASDAVIRKLRLNTANHWSCNLWPRLAPTHRIVRDGFSLTLRCPNALALWRAQTFFTKEPETLAWIDEFAPGDCLFDIGANMGLYSLYAAKRGVSVVAFEPESQNFGLLNTNVFLNALGDIICCFGIALSDHDSLDEMYVNEFGAGQALHAVGEPIDWRHETFAPSFRQGVVCSTLDSLVARMPERFPNHIKLDVDGTESKVVRGAARTLHDERLRSLLIEVNEELPADRQLVAELEKNGFVVKARSHAPMFDEGPYSSVFNYVFSR